MKFTTLFSLFLLCACTSYFPSVTAFVVDTEGNFLRNSGRYFITPVIITGNGGGVQYEATGNETCPISVTQVPSPFSNGLPIEISTPLRIPYIDEGLLVDIAFPFVAPCAPTPSRWTAVYDGGEKLSMKLPGYENTVPGRFKIKSVAVDIGGYNLFFCTENGSCGYVGIEVDSTRTRHLVVTRSAESALWIRFQRATSDLPTTTSAYASA